MDTQWADSPPARLPRDPAIDKREASAAGDPTVLSRGDAVGRYLVLGRLGTGAMGVVYAAYDPELNRKVALKLLRPQENADRVRLEARMVREAKAVARVSHPNVVAVHDVGVHEGQVFMAMEHLPGGTLRGWIAAKKRPWREIVRMFIDIGRGLAGAHAEGLVHRDFKPDNVLIDKNGVPRIVDFGLVRLVQAPTEVTRSDEIDGEPGVAGLPFPAVSATLTRTGALTGTPAYMAPEQFRAGPVDAQTDQFAFCVALYEALYGERPFAGDNIIALADSVTAGRIRPAPRNTQVPAWIRACLVKGLRTEPVARHPGIEELLACLAKDPGKRIRKLAVAGATVVAIAAAVPVSVGLASRQTSRCKSGAARFAAIWEPGPGGGARKAAIRRAFAASGKSYAQQAFSNVAEHFDRYAARWTGMYTDACEATHVRGEQSPEVLDLRMTCLNEHLGNVRALSDVLAAADGRIVENAVSAAAALPSLDRCADVALLRAIVKPPEDPATRTRVANLRTELARLIALRDSGQCARAVPTAEALISEVRAVGYQPLLADTLYESGQLATDCGDIAETLDRFREAHAVAVACRKDDVAAQAAALIPSFAMNRFGQMQVAKDWLFVARGNVARLGRETLAGAMLAQAEGMLALTARDFDRALTQADRSIDITKRLLGPDSPLTIQWEANKGDYQERAGRYEEALRTDVQARMHFERVLGREHPRVALVSNNEGEALNRLGRFAEAEQAFQRAVRLFRQSGAQPDVFGWALTGLGRARLGLKQPLSAVAPLEEALSVRIEKHAPPAQVGETRFALARALWASGTQRSRVLELATNARAEYGDDQGAVAEIDAWLAEAQVERRFSLSTTH